MRGSSNYDYIIVGAGPAGLQMAYFLQKSGRSYVVYEAANQAASFFVRHPRNETLISVNKKYNLFKEDDFNMRHDWNSLLSDDPTMKFTKYSDELFPAASELVKYMNNFAKRLRLNIEYGTRVTRIRKQNSEFFVTTRKVGSTVEEDRICTARCLLMATGAVEERKPQGLKGTELVDTYSTFNRDKELYKNKMVLVVGKGNSGFETANYFADTAGLCHIATKDELRFAWNTHHVGDLRAVNTNILDMHQLKSLHVMFTAEVMSIEKTEAGKFAVGMRELSTIEDQSGYLNYSIAYDRVILCLGWKYITPDIFDDSIHIDLAKNNCYPKLSNCWETSTENLFYIGTTMASIDKQSASGFIHGFRYNIRTLNNLLENRHFGKDLPYQLLPSRDLQAIYNTISERITVSASLYQMNGFLCDVVTFDTEGRTLYYTDLPKNHVLERPEFKTAKDIFILVLEYGSEKFGEAEKPVNSIHGSDMMSNKCAQLLHPIIEHYSYGEYVDQTELQESLVVRYDDNPLGLPQWPTSTNENYVKFFFNDKMHWTDENFDLTPMPKEFIKKWFVPLTEEERSRIPPPIENTICISSQDLLPKENTKERKEIHRPTDAERQAYYTKLAKAK